MICAEFVSDAASAVSLRPTPTQPADLSTCPAVVLTGADSVVLTLPDAQSILAVYSWGVGAVLALWALGYAIGAALKAVRMA
jgi:hypothetical protein